MDRQEFLKSVLGDEGYYCAVGIGKAKPIQKFYSTIEEVCATADDFCANGMEAYFALGTFWNGNSREAGNIQQMRSLYVDIDYGPHHKKAAPYDTYEEAFSDLHKFCKEIGLHRPFIINSGGGIHAYWPFESPVDVEVWRPLAHQLKELCISNNLYIDTGVTADAARILRVPYTKNFKTDESRDVTIVYPAARFGSIEHYKSILGEPIVPLRRANRGQSDDVTDAVLGNQDKSYKRILKKSANGTGCEQIKYMFENRATLSYDAWRASLSIPQFCTDRDEFIHVVSEGHPDYNRDTTEEVANGIKGPFRCETIRGYMAESGRASVCDECPHWGKIGSPIALGKEVAEAKEERTVEATLDGEGETRTYTIPKYPWPYFQGKNGGVFRRIKTKEGDETEVEVYHTDFYVINRMRDKALGDLIVLRLHLPHEDDGVREFTMPMGVVATTDEFRKQLFSNGIVVPKTDDIKNYILASVKSMQYQSGAMEAHSQFGWVDEKCEAFVVGDKKVYANKIEANFPTSTTASLFPSFNPKGSFEEWQKTINFYDKPGMEMHQFVIGLGFGSIFTQFTAVNAGIFHMFSPESGLGKTTALYAAMSIWGDPVRLVMKETDTTASKMLRLQVYKNILLCSDEMTNALPKTLSDEAYQVTSGMQRSRLRTSANEERVRGQPWKTTMVSTGNSSMTEKIGAFKALPKGEMLRILDRPVYKVKGLSKEDTDKLSISLLNNYGHAAVPYLQHVMADIPGVKVLYGKVQALIDKEAGLSSVERFYSVMGANGLTGLLLAKKAGLINFDLSRVTAWVVQTLKEATAEAQEISMDPEEIISALWCEYYNNVLNIKSTIDLRKKGADADYLVPPENVPKGPLVLRYEYDVKKLYIPTKTLNKWCDSKGLSSRELTFQLINSGIGKKDKVRMARGTRSDTGSQPVIVVTCEWMTHEKEQELRQRAEANIQTDPDSIES